MPFRPELHYFYLYLKQHIEQKHKLLCERERADAKAGASEPFHDEIIEYVRNADIVIVDCSTRNPNVFYEMGVAYALDKRIIRITSDAMETLPSDVKHFRFIHYELDKSRDFIEVLDNNLNNILVERYEKLYEIAQDLLQQFKRSTSNLVRSVPHDVFILRVKEAEETQSLPNLKDNDAVAEFVLPQIIENAEDKQLRQQLNEWLLRG